MTLTTYAKLNIAGLSGSDGDAVTAIADSSGNSRNATCGNVTLKITGGQKNVLLAGNGYLSLGADPGGLNAMARDVGYTVIVAYTPTETNVGAQPLKQLNNGTLFAKNVPSNNVWTWFYQDKEASNGGQFAFGHIERYGLQRFYTGNIFGGDKLVVAHRVKRIDSTHVEETLFLNGRRMAKMVTDTSAEGLSWQDSAPFCFGATDTSGTEGVRASYYGAGIYSYGSDAEVLTEMENLRSAAGFPAFPVYDDPTVQIIWAGNSLVQGTGYISLAQQWPRQTVSQLAALTGKNYFTTSYGIGGCRWTTGPTEVTAEQYGHWIKRMLASDRKTYVLLYEDTNQMSPGPPDSNGGGATPAQDQGFAAALYAQVKADLIAAGDGGKVYRFTCLNSVALPTGYANTLNGLRRAADSNATLIDVAAISELSDNTNTTYFQDGTHPTPAGYAKAAAPVAAQLASDIVPVDPVPPSGTPTLAVSFVGGVIRLTRGGTVANASGFRLERIVGGTATALSDTMGATFDDTGFTGSGQSYRITPYNAYGNGIAISIGLGNGGGKGGASTAISLARGLA